MLRPCHHLALIGAFSAVAMCAVGCGDAEGEGDDAKAAATKSALWLVQEDIDKAAWDSEVKADTALAALAADVKLAFQAAGTIEDTDGTKVLWAEFAKDRNDARKSIVTLLRSCGKNGTCEVARGAYGTQGASFTKADGTKLAVVGLGAPALNKKLKTSNNDKGTVIAIELKRAAMVDPVLAKFHVDNGTWGKRRLLLINRFGAQMGVGLAKIIAAANKTGLFDEVYHLQFARRRDIDLMLPQLNPLDVVVWVAAGVVKPFGGKPYRSVGMTLSRGIVGDELYHSTALGKLLDVPPLGGPGLVILAGGDSLTTHKSTGDVLGYKLNLGPYRPVVGINGHITLAQAEAGVVALLAKLAAGDNLDAAMAAASGALGSATFRTALITELSEVWTLPKAAKDFWVQPGSGKQQEPKSAKLQVYVKIDPICADVSNVGGECNAQALQKGIGIAPGKLTPILDTRFICEPKFNGPYFSCEVKNPTIKADFWLKGLLTGTKKGDSVLLHAQGQSDGKVKDFTVIGAGIIQNVDVGGGTTVISFSGPAAGSTFWNQDGQCCLAKTPLLTGHASNLLSKLELKP